jgi:hypothetical protein
MHGKTLFRASFVGGWMKQPFLVRLGAFVACRRFLPAFTGKILRRAKLVVAEVWGF